MTTNQNGQLLCRTETECLRVPGHDAWELCAAHGRCWGTLLCCLGFWCCLDLGHCCCFDLHDSCCYTDYVKKIEKACLRYPEGREGHYGSAAGTCTKVQQGTGSGDGAHAAESGGQLATPASGAVSSCEYGMMGLSVRTSVLAAWSTAPSAPPAPAQDIKSHPLH